MRGAIVVVVLAAHVLLLLFFSSTRRPAARSEDSVLTTMFFVAPEPQESWQAPLLYRSNTPLPRPQRASEYAAPTQPPSNDTQQQPPATDWHAQLEQTADQQVQQLIAAERRANALTANFKPMVTSTAPPGKPRIPWDYAATHRLQTVPGVGILYNFNDRCTLLISFFPFVSCKIGKK